MIKYSHFRSLKIKTYLNIALEGRLSIFYIVFNLQKCLILGTKHGRLHYLATLKIFLKLPGSTPPASACIISDKQSGITVNILTGISYCGAELNLSTANDE